MACKVCQHPERQRIEMLHVAGVSLERIGAKFNLSKDTVWRHVQNHLSEEQKASYLIGPKKLAELAEVAAEESATLLDYLGILRSTIFFQLDKRAAEGNVDAICKLSGQANAVLQSIGKVTGEISNLASSTIVNVTHNTAILNSAPFAELQSGLLEVCARHPDARADIIALCHRLEAKHAPRAPQAQHGAKLIEGVREAAHA